MVRAHHQPAFSQHKVFELLAAVFHGNSLAIDAVLDPALSHDLAPLLPPHLGPVPREGRTQEKEVVDTYTDRFRSSQLAPVNTARRRSLRRATVWCLQTRRGCFRCYAFVSQLT